MGVLRVEGARLYYQLAGSGPPLVLLHGLGASGLDWEYQVPEFSKHFRVVVPDFRGHGASDRTGDYSVQRFADDTWRLLDRLRIAAPTLVGHSMGGAVAMQMALDRPGCVPRMVLTNTLPSFRTDTVGKRFMLWTRLMMMSLLGPRRLAEIMTRRSYPRADQAALRARVAKRNARNDRNVYAATIRALTRWSVEDRVAQLAMPVLVMAAEHDYVQRLDVERFVSTLPNGWLRHFPGARHGLPLEMPAEFNGAVLEFLRQAAEAPAAGSAPAAAHGS
ncbi:MAG: alpha/beta fold hydrolase [Gammaproteobacteria bacterium]